MSLSGRLETLDLAGVLQTLSVGAATGRLTLTRLDAQAVLVLRKGRVIYAAGGSAFDTLASRLLRQGLVGEADLLEALARQHEGDEPRRLAEVVVDMGLLAAGTLQAVVRSHMQELVGELIGWKSGFFRFEPVREDEESVPEVDLGDFVLPGGLAPQELLMRAVAALDSGTMPPMRRPPGLLAAAGQGGGVAGAAAEEPARSPTGSFPVDFTGEAMLSLLRFAAQILSRAVVFAIADGEARGIGEFGVTPGAASGAEAVRELALTLREPSVVRLAVERRRTYVGPLEPTAANLRLVERLGGTEVKEAVAIPLIVRGEVSFVLYGDNAPGTRPIGPLDTLEAEAARAARVIEKTLAAREREAGRS